jgi:hypothetical protein
MTLASQRQSSHRRFRGIAYAHQMGTSIGRLVEDLELLVLCATDEELENQVTYLPLR